MKFKQVNEITKEAFLSGITDDVIFKRMLYQLIDYMPIQELKEIFQLIKIDPNSKESLEKMKDWKTPAGEKELIMRLRERGIIRYEATVETKTNTILDNLQITYGEENSSEKNTIR
jgi:hypothetical protein